MTYFVAFLTCKGKIDSKIIVIQISAPPLFKVYVVIITYSLLILNYK